MDSTTYYNTNASRYITDTFNADMSAIRNRFISYLPIHGTILDAGCGPGRDVKAFVEAGYKVYAMDASQAMVEHCSTIIGDRCRLATFQEYETDIKFDGIWACASLLHIEGVAGDRDLSLQSVIKKFTMFLKPGGVFFMSFKYSKENYVKDGRYFNCQTEESMRELLKTCTELSVADLFITNDVRDSRADEKWVNVMVKKS